MAIDSFNTILTAGLKQGHIPGKTKQARDWFRETAAKFKGVSEGNLMQSGNALTSIINVGNMYMFVYDAKHKKTLPYWDAFPLVFPVSKTPDGFIGLNMHYLPLPLRAKLMDMLYTMVTDTNTTEKTKLKATYTMLKDSIAHKLIKPCVKRYLTANMSSRFIFVEPAEWDIALFLPVQRFQNATSYEVWRKSTIETMEAD